MKKRKILLTAGLPYSNGRLHVGHVAGCHLPGDICRRYFELQGHDVRYICGSDDHGVGIVISAQKEGKSPAEVAQHYYRHQIEDFTGLGVHFSAYGSTSQSKFHTKKSQDFFLSMYQKGLFEKRVSQQFYDESKEMFLPDRFVQGDCGHCGAVDQNGDQCENCGKILDDQSLKNARSVLSGNPAHIKDTVHWFLSLEKFQVEVEQWLERAVLRETTRSYVRSLINNGLATRSMTRDIFWGIPLPIDDPEAKGKVLYVWFDAPIGYISNTMEMCESEGRPIEEYAQWWKNPECEIYHFIGEDNTIFHCLIWIAMLAAEGSHQLPKGVIVNQFLNIKFPDQTEAGKISKSRGTAVWIHEYLSGGGDPDVLRYYLTAIAPEKARTVYMPDDLIQKNNTDLANVIGNFVNRIVSFNKKYVGDFVPSFDPAKVSDIDRAFTQRMEVALSEVTTAMESFALKQALQVVMDFARDCNKYVDDKKPWTTRKDDMATTQVTLYYALEAIKFLAITLAPFMPQKAQKIADIFNLNLADRSVGWGDAVALKLKPGAPLADAGILFQKIE